MHADQEAVSGCIRVDPRLKLFHLAIIFNIAALNTACGAAVVKSQAMEGRSGAPRTIIATDAITDGEAAIMDDRMRN